MDKKKAQQIEQLQTEEFMLLMERQARALERLAESIALIVQNFDLFMALYRRPDESDMPF